MRGGVRESAVRQWSERSESGVSEGMTGGSEKM